MALELAGRGTRLGAALVDGGISYVVLMVVAGWVGFEAYRSGLSSWAHENLVLIIVVGGLSCLYLLVILVIQIVMLHRYGQTIGKRILNIKIVKNSTEENGGFATNFAMRALIPGVIQVIPYVGFAFGLIDILFIFRDDKRCLHDLIADTKVVQA